MATIGDVLRLKINGETVIVIGNRVDQPGVLVRRAKQTEDGILYVAEGLLEVELECVEDNIKREFWEMTYKHKLMSDHMKTKDSESEETLDKLTGTIQ